MIYYIAKKNTVENLKKIENSKIPEIKKKNVFGSPKKDLLQY